MKQEYVYLQNKKTSYFEILVFEQQSNFSIFAVLSISVVVVGINGGHFPAISFPWRSTSHDGVSNSYSHNNSYQTYCASKVLLPRFMDNVAYVRCSENLRKTDIRKEDIQNDKTE